MPEPDNILTVKELAQYLKLAESTIYKLAQDGEIPGRKIGGTWRFYLDSINEWMGGKEPANRVDVDDKRKKRVEG